MIHKEKKPHLESVWCPFCGRVAKLDMDTGELRCPVCGRTVILSTDAP